MPMIYKRFTDKTAEEWRQIYKVWTIGDGEEEREPSGLMIETVSSTIRIPVQKRFGTSHR